MLEAISDSDKEISDKSLDAVKQWLFKFNRSFIMPSDKQTEKIRKTIHKLGGMLPADIQKELLLTLPS